MESGGGAFHGYHQMNIHPTMSLNLSNNNSNNNKNKGAVVAGSRNKVGVGGEEEECRVREQDRLMPIANVIRIMRKMVPPHGKISDDAKETVQECVSEFIGFITGEANDRCQREQRKTITAEDILYAMNKLGFESYVDPLSLFLHRYRQLDSLPPPSMLYQVAPPGYYPPPPGRV